MKIKIDGIEEVEIFFKIFKVSNEQNLISC